MARQSKYCKELMVKELSAHLNSTDTLIVTNYKGLSAQELNALRSEIRNVFGEYLVVKDSMAKKAFADGPNNSILGLIEGEVGIVLDKKEDLTYISKALERFRKDHQALQICGGVVNGALVSKEDIATLAVLPSREILLQRFANALNAPMQNLAGVLNGIIARLVYALDEVRNKTGSGVRVSGLEKDTSSNQPTIPDTRYPNNENKEAQNGG